MLLLSLFILEVNQGYTNERIIRLNKIGIFKNFWLFLQLFFLHHSIYIICVVL